MQTNIKLHYRCIQASLSYVCPSQYMQRVRRGVAVLRAGLMSLDPQGRRKRQPAELLAFHAQQIKPRRPMNFEAPFVDTSGGSADVDGCNGLRDGQGTPDC